ncbi:cryptochrome/photolyase family protein [Candidatus Sumerlaeota bacterium]|nr:cryptochrome/photolyase family protein [Candidatus Sumerlaeota bacterium]
MTSVWVLGNQLSHEDNSALRTAPRDAPVVMIESLPQALSRPFSRMRIALIWSAMRHFAQELRREGRAVEYHAVGREPSPGDEATFVDILRTHIERRGTERLLVMAPADWTMHGYIAKARRHLGIAIEVTSDRHFVSGHGTPERAAEANPAMSPDALTRELRRRCRILVDAKGEPEGGQWFFEAKGKRPEEGKRPSIPRIEPDDITREVIATVQARFPDRVGDLDQFGYPVCRHDALQWLEDFVEQRLPTWGDHHDTMEHGRSVLSQSMLSPALNLGLLGPLEVAARVERAYQAGGVPLPAAVGFIRDLLGWREFVHTVHWTRSPGHAESNFFDARRPLPEFLWTGETRCACLADIIHRSLATAHASRSERLMVLGNYLLMIGADPAAACEWFGSVFADAWEWCAVPNTIGVALWADGGVMASKPYAASANYISRLSDHCAHCGLDHTTREGPDACPFNYLYWNFVVNSRPRLGHVPRMSKAFEHLDRLGAREITLCASQTARHLEEIGVGGPPKAS